MSSAPKIFGCSLKVEAEGEVGGDCSIAREVSRSGNQPDGEVMSMLDWFSPCDQMEIGNFNPCFVCPESNSDSGPVFVDSEPEFIDFFDRESCEVERVGEFYIRPNQRVTTSSSSTAAFDIWGFHGMEQDIELGLGIGIGSGSGSGQSRGDLDRVWSHREIESGRVEAGMGLSPVGEAMVLDEEVEWEDLQNAINWVEEPSQVNFLRMEEEEEDEDEVEEASGDDLWEILLDVNNVDVLEDSEDIMVDAGLMDLDLDLGVYLATIDEDYGDYNVLLAQMFDNEDAIMGSPPASKTVVDDLPVVEITSDELSNGNVIVCAICKDDILVEEKVHKLPCRHYYHGDCIIPWLEIRNTCPVCRYELPTDDLEYEMNRRLQRAL